VTSVPGETILVIKLGALGDFILAQSAFAAIRKHHRDARITLLTTKAFAEFGRMSPYFDNVWIDEKPKWWQLPGVLRLRRLLNSQRFSRVYDLQTSDRTGFYYRLFKNRPEWSGIARGASHPDPTLDRAAVQSFDLRVNQLRVAGIADVPLADLSWIKGSGVFTLPEKYMLLVPGCAPHRPDKRWPALSYAALAARLSAKGYVPVVIGDKHEVDTARIIASASPDVIDLTTKTSLFDIADLARRAVAAIGNDTGPMHIAAAVGCPSLVLFSAASNPAHSSPVGKSVTVLQRDDLANLSVEEVEKVIPV
jgi:ADP-heptose:LPS heptosyltransferase